MGKHLKSSWWVHIPGLCAIIAMIAIMIWRRPWPGNVPVHFDFYWRPNRWGSPWQFSVFPVLGSGILISGVVASAIWSFQEAGHKTFNILLPVLVAPLGAIAGIHFWYWWNISLLSRTGHAGGAWIWTGIFAAAMCAASVVLELFRKAVPFSETEEEFRMSPAEIEADRAFRAQLPADGPWTYFESSSTGAVPWILCALGLILVGAGFSFLHQPNTHVPGYILIASGGLLIALMFVLGSIQLRVNAEQLVLLGGVFGIRLLRLKLADITDIKVIALRPLKTFGGWGIRYAGNTRAYIFSGGRGVRMLSRNGKVYVVSARNAEKFAAALRTGRERAMEGE